MLNLYTDKSLHSVRRAGLCCALITSEFKQKTVNQRLRCHIVQACMCNLGLFTAQSFASTSAACVCLQRRSCGGIKSHECTHTKMWLFLQRLFVSAAFAFLCVSAVNCGSCLATANQSAGRGQSTDAKRQLTIAAGKQTSDTPASFDWQIRALGADHGEESSIRETTVGALVQSPTMRHPNVLSLSGSM